jgi:pimeloyl-ACP methyl ester carboxylesterase
MTIPLAAVEYGAGRAAWRSCMACSAQAATGYDRAAPRTAHHRVIAVDLRNRGGSPWAATMDYREMAEDVRMTLQGRGYERFALLGHSMGRWR